MHQNPPNVRVLSTGWLL